MTTTTHNFVPVNLLLPLKPVEKPVIEEKEKPARTVQPEIQLRKLVAEAVQPRLVRSELLVLLVFLAVALSAIVFSVQELTRLVRSNAIEHVAARALSDSTEVRSDK